MHFVENEHAMATGVTHRRTFDEFADVVDTVVASGVEFEHVKTCTPFDGQTRIALTTRFAFVRVGAVEHLGQDACGRSFAGAPRAREQICLATPIVGNGIANGTFMVVPNRYGNEGKISFYGSSIISDPYGRILARAGREGDVAAIAEQAREVQPL